ncbi:hypothetical protein [Deinococcus ruber]|uniref:TrbL/VirB6 plasmid conjugal transfer protein n=1 Tax=Deinococcus ruber TaxID=1848197 RepID=A0A918F941_9DEIO|nr:hypothetical protein [Deinococcus ruber]GGR12885.1 hypothetical protein GCM10008957_27300 [Deinococcus ruber]
MSVPRWLRSVLMLLALVLTGVASAQSLPSECTLDPAAISNNTLTAFIPNAPCLMAQNVLLWGQWGLWKAVATVGLTLCSGLFFWKVFLSVLEGTPEKALRPFLWTAGLCLLLAPATQGKGVVPDAQAQMMTWLNELYVVSSSIGNHALSDGPLSVQAKTKKLGQNIALLVARASYADDIKRQLDAVAAGSTPGDITDPDLVSRLYAQRITADTGAAESVFSGNSGIFNIGYAVLYGLFAIFAAMIASIGWGMQLVLLLLPVALAFIPTGKFAPSGYVGATCLAAYLTIAVLPLMVSSVAVIGLSIPADRLTPTVTTMNADLKRNLEEYQTIISQGCGFTDVTCSINQSVINPIKGDLASFKELFFQVLLTLATMLIGLGISAVVLRRPPALISAMFGAMGGGESSGVPTNALSQGLKMMMGGQVMQGLIRTAQQGSRAAAGRSAGVASAGGSSVGSAGSGGSGASTPAPTPDSNVKGGGGSSAAGSGNTPPPDVGGPSSGRGATFTQSYGEARQRGAGTWAATAAATLESSVVPRVAAAPGAAVAHLRGLGQDAKAAATTKFWDSALGQGGSERVSAALGAVSAARQADPGRPAPAAPANVDDNELFGKGQGRPLTNQRMVTAAQAGSPDASAKTRQIAVARADRAAAVRAMPGPVAPAPAPAPVVPARPRVAAAASRNVPGVTTSNTPVVVPAPPPAAPAQTPVVTPPHRNAVTQARMASAAANTLLTTPTQMTQPQQAGTSSASRGTRAVAVARGNRAAAVAPVAAPPPAAPSPAPVSVQPAVPTPARPVPRAAVAASREVPGVTRSTVAAVPDAPPVPAPAPRPVVVPPNRNQMAQARQDAAAAQEGVE